MKTKSEAVDEYIKFRGLTNRSRSINDIEFHIRQFVNSTRVPLEDFDEHVLVTYLNKIKGKYKTNSLNSIRSSFLKPFIKWLFVDWSSRFRNLDKLCQTERATSPYTADDMLSEEKFKELVKAEESTFWKAYFLTLFYGGCRPTEVCTLRWENVEFDSEGAFITIHSKKNKEDFIKFVPHDVAFYLKKLRGNGEFVFTNTRTKKPITVKGAYHRIRELSKELFGHSIDLYTLRHSIATINYDKDVKDDIVARQMGHTKSMKKRYAHTHRARLREQAKSIYINPEELPPEKKHKLEMEVEALKQSNAELLIKVDSLLSGGYEKEMQKIYEQFATVRSKK